MPIFNPSAVLVDLQDKPFKMGPIEDPIARAKLLRLRGEAEKAKGVEKARLEEELDVAIADLTPVLTVGRAVMHALTSPLRGDEDLGASTKVDFMEWALRVRAAQREGATSVVKFSNEEMEKVKGRVNACYPSPMVVAQVFKAITADPPAEAPGARPE